MNILTGLKVVDVTAWAFVPSAGGVLADWGADVVKVEAPDRPDPMRLLGGTLEPGAASPLFKHYSRGKRAIAIDLTTDEGRDILYRLASDADVFLTSYLPRTRQALGIDVDDIRAVNPRHHLARGSGQGPKGPEADRPGYDGITWWGRGSLAQSAMDVTGSSWPTGMVGHGDGMSGMTLAGGVCAALLHRGLTGESVVVDGSLLGTATWFNGMALVMGQSVWARPPRTFEEPTPPPGREGSPATSTPYVTVDRRFIMLMFMGDDDRDFADLCHHLDRPELASDDRFARAAARQENSRELLGILDEIFRTSTLSEWKERLVTMRGPWSPLQTPEELFDDPQTIANGFLRHVDYPDGGLKVPAPPILFDEDPGDPPRAPDFAEHTDEILRELGCSDDDISRLRDSGAVA